MNENIEKLEENILVATRDIENLINQLENIKGDTICVGTGGSKVVSRFASLVLAKKNNIKTIEVNSRDLQFLNLKLYDNIFIASYSGKNYGVKCLLDNHLKKYLLTTRKTKIKDEKLLHYELEKESSFISLNATLVPMAILLKYYLGDNFDIIIREMFKKVNKFLDINISEAFLNIFSGFDSSVSECFIESTLVESGIVIPLVHDKYSYCHGRSTINKSHFKEAIYLGYATKDLDNTLVDALNIQMRNYVIIKNEYDDLVINQFYLTLQSIYLLRNIAHSKNIDLSKIDYDKDVVKNLYYFKGSM